MLNEKSLHGKTILVVDDEEGFREIYCEELREAKAFVLAAASGNEALALAKEYKIDVIISDMNMSDGDGITLLEQIKSINPFRPVVILVSGHSRISIADIYDKGAAALFSKPIRFNRLIDCLYNALLNEEERWIVDKKTNPESPIEIELQVKSIDSLVKNNVFNIGHGGMFLKLGDDYPSVGSRVHLKMILTATQYCVFECVAVCRWVRSKSDENLPTGIGLEFESLTRESLDTVLNFLDQYKPRAYIPKMI